MEQSGSCASGGSALRQSERPCYIRYVHFLRTDLHRVLHPHSCTDERQHDTSSYGEATSLSGKHCRRLQLSAVATVLPLNSHHALTCPCCCSHLSMVLIFPAGCFYVDLLPKATFVKVTDSFLDRN